MSLRTLITREKVLEWAFTSGAMAICCKGATRSSGSPCSLQLSTMCSRYSIMSSRQPMSQWMIGTHASRPSGKLVGHMSCGDILQREMRYSCPPPPLFMITNCPCACATQYKKPACCQFCIQGVIALSHYY